MACWACPFHVEPDPVDAGDGWHDQWGGDQHLYGLSSPLTDGDNAGFGMTCGNLRYFTQKG